MPAMPISAQSILPLLSRRRLGGLVAGATVAIATGASGRPAAAALAQPAGKIILSISGKIGIANHDGVAEFDREMLESLGADGFTTATPWYDHPVKFEGVRLAQLMQQVGATGDHITAQALNDYSTDIPIEDFTRYNVVLALKRDGDYMPVKDKGPLFVVYPYDSDPELKHQRFYSRSAWQVRRIIVK